MSSSTAPWYHFQTQSYLPPLVLFHPPHPRRRPTCMYIGKHSIFLFASFVFNNYNFLKGSKAGVSVVIVIVVTRVMQPKIQRICSQKFSCHRRTLTLIHKEAFQRLKHFHHLLHGKQQREAQSISWKVLFFFNSF